MSAIKTILISAGVAVAVSAVAPAGAVQHLLGSTAPAAQAAVARTTAAGATRERDRDRQHQESRELARQHDRQRDRTRQHAHPAPAGHDETATEAACRQADASESHHPTAEACVAGGQVSSHDGDHTGAHSGDHAGTHDGGGTYCGVRSRLTYARQIARPSAAWTASEGSKPDTKRTTLSKSRRK